MKGLVQGYAAKWMNQDLNPQLWALKPELLTLYGEGWSRWSWLWGRPGEASVALKVRQDEWGTWWWKQSRGTRETSQGSVDGTWREGEGGNCHRWSLIFLETLLLPSLLRLSANAFLMSWILLFLTKLPGVMRKTVVPEGRDSDFSSGLLLTEAHDPL